MAEAQSTGVEEGHSSVGDPVDSFGRQIKEAAERIADYHEGLAY